ncbi:EAL domain-containing protein [Desulfoplanes sp.]
MPHVRYLSNTFDCFMVDEFDDDPLLQKSSMGFCIADCHGRIYGANRRINAIFQDYPGGFCGWWNAMADEIRKSRLGACLEPWVVFRTWTPLDGTRRSVMVAGFNAGPEDKKFLLFVSRLSTSDKQGAICREQMTGQKEWSLPMTALRHNGCLMQALSQGVFSLAYQPVYDVRSGAAAGFEAKLRWADNHEDRIRPSSLEFLQGTGGALVLGIWMVVQACRDLRSWNTGGGPGRYFVQVGMSSEQLGSPCILHVLQHVLEDNGIDPSLVWIKTPKKSFGTKSPREQLLLHRYHALGINFIVEKLRPNLSDLSYFFGFSVIPFKAVHLRNNLVPPHVTKKQLDLFATFAKIFSCLGIHVLTKLAGSEDCIASLRTTTCRYVQDNGTPTVLRSSQIIDAVAKKECFPRLFPSA